MYCTGEKHHAWIKSGRKIHTNGYILVRAKEHPLNYKGWYYEHRLVMEKYLGRFLKKGECIHHMNGDKTDNKIKNLKLFVNGSTHSIVEKPKVFSKTCRVCGKTFMGGRNYHICDNCKNRTCQICGKRFLLNIDHRKANANIYCSLKCRNEASRKRFLFNNPRKIAPDGN